MCALVFGYEDRVMSTPIQILDQRVNTRTIIRKLEGSTVYADEIFERGEWRTQTDLKMNTQQQLMMGKIYQLMGGGNG